MAWAGLGAHIEGSMVVAGPLCFVLCAWIWFGLTVVFCGHEPSTLLWILYDSIGLWHDGCVWVFNYIIIMIVFVKQINFGAKASNRLLYDYLEVLEYDE